MKIKKYWEIDYCDKIQISEADALDAREEKLTDAVRLRMIADVPLGALLSGGVDSSVVVALMAKLSNEPVRTFSIGFQAEAFNELPWAQQAAERCGTQHHPDIVKGDVEHLLPQLARHYGEPYADDSAVPSISVSSSARRHVTVAMTFAPRPSVCATGHPSHSRTLGLAASDSFCRDHPALRHYTSHRSRVPSLNDSTPSI